MGRLAIRVGNMQELGKRTRSRQDYSRSSRSHPKSRCLRCRAPSIRSRVRSRCHHRTHALPSPRWLQLRRLLLPLQLSCRHRPRMALRTYSGLRRSTHICSCFQRPNCRSDRRRSLQIELHHKSVSAIILRTDAMSKVSTLQCYFAKFSPSTMSKSCTLTSA